MLSVRDLRVRYGAVEALRGVTLEVSAGEITAVLGENGAGKSSLVRAISGQVAASGEVVLDGRPLLGLSPVEIVCLGVVQCPEGRQLFSSLTVGENIRLGATRLGLPLHDLRQDLDRVFELFPVVRERWQQPAGTLSGGEQQMVAIARALVARPRLVLVDEPSLGLSPLLVERLFGRLADIARLGVGVLLVDQNARAALGVAARAYVLRTGQVLLAGASAELRQALEGRDGYLA